MPRAFLSKTPLFSRFFIDHSRNMKLLLSIRILRELVNKFALFFLPVFLFQLGQSHHFLSARGMSDFQSGALLLASFYILSRSVMALMAIPAGDFIRKYGYSASLMLSHLLYAVTLMSLQMSVHDIRWLALAACTDGINTVLMWGPFNTLFSKEARKARMGRSLGVVQILLNTIWMIGPALSGVVIYLFGYDALFSAGLCIVAVNIALAYLVRVPHERDDVSMKELLFWINDRRFIKLGISIAGKTINDIAIFAWPLYVFLLLGNTEKVGFLYSFSFLLSIILQFFISRKIDGQEEKRPFFVSGGVISALWVARAQIFSPLSIAIVDAFDKLTGNFHWLFFDRVLLNRGKGRDAFSYFIYRELIVAATAVIFWSLFAVIFLVWPFGWRGIFLLAAVGVLLSLLISKKHE